MSHQTMITVQGWVGSVPMQRKAAGVDVLSFRLACTPRHYQRSTDSWVDGVTQWYGVNAWRRLADHAGRSLQQGDAVVVHGRLDHRTYVNKSGKEVLALDIEAVTIGHDLTRGVATFAKAAPSLPDSGADPERERAAAAA